MADSKLDTPHSETWRHAADQYVFLPGDVFPLNLNTEEGAERVLAMHYELVALRSETGRREADPYGEQPTHFEMARTRMLRKRIADILATYDANDAVGLKDAIGRARGIGLTKAEQETQQDYDCPHAAPFRYCETCKVDPCPLGLKREGRRGC